MKKIYFFVNHSLGELDSIFPLIQKISFKNKKKVVIIFTVKNIYNDYLKNKFYLFVTKKLNIKIQLSYIPNKFDINLKSTKYLKLKVLFYNFILLLKNFFFLQAKYFLFEHSDSRYVTFSIKKLSKLLKLNIYVFQHGQSFNQKSSSITKKNKSNLIFLLFDNINLEFAKNLGYKKFITIGFPKFYTDWINLLKDYNKSKIKIVTIFTREPFHKYYLTPKIYKELLINSYESIRSQLGNIKIVLKPHPREKLEYINQIIKDNQFTNIKISHEHAGILSAQSEFTISFWCSTILDSLSLGVPSVEYFIENENFRLLEPKGSLYKFYHIHSVDNKNDLKNFIHDAIENKYILPSIIKRFKIVPNFELV